MFEYAMKKMRQSGMDKEEVLPKINMPKNAVKLAMKKNKVPKEGTSALRKSFVKKSQENAWANAYHERYEEVKSEIESDLESGNWKIDWGYQQSVDIELTYEYNGKEYTAEDSLDIGDWGNPDTVLDLDMSLEGFNFDTESMIEEIADDEATKYADEHWEEYDDESEEDE